jgi:hypothetical protein
MITVISLSYKISLSCATYNFFFTYDVGQVVHDHGVRDGEEVPGPREVSVLQHLHEELVHLPVYLFLVGGHRDPGTRR